MSSKLDSIAADVKAIKAGLPGKNTNNSSNAPANGGVGTVTPNGPGHINVNQVDPNTGKVLSPTDTTNDQVDTTDDIKTQIAAEVRSQLAAQKKETLKTEIAATIKAEVKSALSDPDAIKQLATQIAKSIADQAAGAAER